MTIKTTVVPVRTSVVQAVNSENQSIRLVPGSGGSMILEYTTQKSPRLNATNAVTWTAWPFGLVTLPKSGLLLPQVTGIRVTALVAAGTFVLDDSPGAIWADESLGTSEEEVVKLYRSLNTASDSYLSKDGAALTAANCLAIPTNSTYAFDAFVVFRRTDVMDVSGMTVLTGCIDRNVAANTTALVDSVTTVVIQDDTGSITILAEANTTLGSLDIKIVGAPASPLRWVAKVTLVEITA